jgi:outer membrane receptor for monomeric catechols
LPCSVKRYSAPAFQLTRLPDLAVSIYAFDTLALTDRVEVNGGLRLDSYHTKYDSATACGGSGRPLAASAKLLPPGGCCEMA